MGSYKIKIKILNFIKYIGWDALSYNSKRKTPNLMISWVFFVDIATNIIIMNYLPNLYNIKLKTGQWCTLSA